MVLKLTKKQYSELFGATKGDKIRLGDTDLLIEVEKDLISHGDECVFGGGKTLRDGLAQTSGVTNANGALDFVVTNAVVLRSGDWHSKRRYRNKGRKNCWNRKSWQSFGNG